MNVDRELRLRASHERETEAVRMLHFEAFDEGERDAVSRLAIALPADPSAQPSLSLVAESGAELLGSAIFSKVTIEQSAGTTMASILCPLAVRPDHHRQGIGSALIARGLEILAEQGVEIVLVLGDPNYYRRSGFRSRHRLAPPYPIDYPEAWMAIELIDGVLKDTKGKVRCSGVLDSEEYW
ncbi:MAG: N-acetyltransferase [Pseudomonadota bacterium]